VARLIFLPWLFVAVWSVGLSAQRGTDFSGSWVLEDGTAAAADTPTRLTVRQPITNTTVRGDLMPPAYLTLAVTRHFADKVEEATYRIGTMGGVVGGLPDRGATPSGRASMSREWSVRWREQALWMEEWTLTAGVVTGARTEVWRLDERGRLIVTLEIREGEKTDRRTLAYRRDSTQK
jgi:hypothetical protein